VPRWAAQMDDHRSGPPGPDHRTPLTGRLTVTTTSATGDTARSRSPQNLRNIGPTAKVQIVPADRKGVNLPLFLIVAGTLAAAHFSGVAIGRFLGRTAGAVDATELDAYRNALGFVEGVAPSALMLT